MANEAIGYIKCLERGCDEVAEVRKAGGKRSSLYTCCPSCGTNQGNGESRQQRIKDGMKSSKEDALSVPANYLTGGYSNEPQEAISDTDEESAIPSKNQASSELEQADIIPEDIPTPKPKGKPTAPPTVLAIIALFIAILSAFFATRKPKGQTA